MNFSIFYLVVRCLLACVMELTRREASKDVDVCVSQVVVE